MIRVYVIYCPSEGGYWADIYNKFKGEIYASHYNTHSEYGKDLERATKAVKGQFVEIKEMCIYE